MNDTTLWHVLSRLLPAVDASARTPQVVRRLVEDVGLMVVSGLLAEHANGSLSAAQFQSAAASAAKAAAAIRDRLTADTPAPTAAHRVYCQEWEESERGWGVRPDGYSLHPTEAAHQKHMKEYYARQPKDHVPDEYSRAASEPCWIDVTAETHAEVARCGLLWVRDLKDVLAPGAKRPVGQAGKPVR